MNDLRNGNNEKKRYDVIVVGAGNGGLAAAAALAKGGKRVVLFEKNRTPGGVATSFRRGRFDFEVSLHELCSFGRDERRSGSVRQLFDFLGISDRIEWVNVPEAYRLITYDSPDPIDVTMPFGIDAYIDAMDRYIPGSRADIQAVFDLAAKYLNATGSMGQAKSPADAIRRLLRHKDFLHTCTMSMNDGVAAAGLKGRAADVFKGYWAYLCADGNDLTFMHYLSMVNSYIELGSVIPKARSLEMTLTLAECIEENGGTIYLNSEVGQILVRNGSVYGIVTADGREYFSDEVICDISPNTVYGTLIDPRHISERDVRKTNARELGGRGFCVFLGLDRSAEELGLRDYSYFIYPDMDITKQIGNMAAPETNGVQNTVCLNAADPDASPAGTCILTMTTLFTSDWWEDVSEEDYHRYKDEFAAKMVAVFEKATGVEIADYIEEMEIATPVTFARYMNSPQGSIYGYKESNWDSIFSHKLMDKKYSDTAGLEFVGGYGMNLNGYSSAFGTGFSKAKYILTRDGLL